MSRLLNKLAIPTILVAIIMVAGLFAFAPVEQASTVHATVGVSGTVFELQKTLPLNDDDVDWTLFCGSEGVLITSIFSDNTATVGDPSFEFAGITLGGTDLEWAESMAMFVAQNDVREWRDMIRTMESFNDFGGYPGPIPCTAGDSLVMTFNANGDGNDKILNVIVVVEGSTSDVTLE